MLLSLSHKANFFCLLNDVPGLLYQLTWLSSRFFSVMAHLAKSSQSFNTPTNMTVVGHGVISEIFSQSFNTPTNMTIVIKLEEKRKCQK
jgi:hypothetical protein